jgi:hypothetical protein
LARMIRHASCTNTLITAAFVCALPSAASAQAWVGDPNSLSLSVGYNFAFATKILESEGNSLDGIRTFQHTMLFSAEYVTPLPGLAVAVQLPVLGLQYRGADFEGEIIRPHGRYDDKSTHFVATDFRLDIRYGIIEDPFALAVKVGGSIPTHEYETQGFTSAGRGLKQLHLHVAAGRTLEPFLPALYFHAQYTFNLVENFKTEFEQTSHAQHYSNVNLQVGYFIIPELQINIAADLRIAHGGVDFLAWNALHPAERDFHDAILRENAYLLGGGLGYEVIEGFTISALARAFLAGTNTRNAHFFGVDLTYQIF